MRRVSILGDSVSTFEGCVPEGFRVYYEGERRHATGVELPSDTWWAQVISGMGGVPWSVGAYSGSLVEGAGFPAGESVERVAALARDGVAPDVVLVFMGINDYGWGGAAAQAAGRGNAVPSCLDLANVEPQAPGLADASAAKLFEAAYERMLMRILGAYPQAAVRCCTLCPGRVVGCDRSTFAYNLRGVPIDRYNDAIRAAAARAGCSVVDIAALGFDYEAVDGTHPTARGMRQLAMLMLRAMGLADDAVVAETGAPRSHRSCEEPCVGCEHAASTGSAWLCVCRR
ncbi:GDSL family lipase [Gordonibacter sp. An230]|uniref:SGNH/GDSL hydrolase family protein n=1 Tax=Gordonibacter sp. An230 TaxID=1965592 RepID=UPI000B37D41A|nr:SGNH/GDSL hydrolase family protein [Gordonibacter sp. An230]OUO85907.1 GDSL family lipase [Gordonibacter sp. An230]